MRVRPRGTRIDLDVGRSMVNLSIDDNPTQAHVLINPPFHQGTPTLTIGNREAGTGGLEVGYDDIDVELAN